MLEELVTNDVLQDKFDAARKAGVSPCAWLPPLLSEMKANKYKFYETVTDPGKFKDDTEADQCLKDGRDADEKPPHKSDSFPKMPDKEKNKDSRGWIDPFSDFTHTDDTEFPAKELKTVVDLLEANSTQEKVASLARLRRLVGPDAPGMKRLGRVFDWVLYRTTDLLGALNAAAKAEDETAYEAARENYIEFLKDLDDHEPERKSKQIDPRCDLKDDTGKIIRPKLRKSGYGRTIKWTCLIPVIFQGKIFGARVIVHWNPHSSSNGIPVKHS